jgi:hypothetical protein
LGPVVPDEIFVGSLCPLIAASNLWNSGLNFAKLSDAIDRLLATLGRQPSCPELTSKKSNCPMLSDR